MIRNQGDKQAPPAAHVHHWSPKREGVWAGDPVYVHACACGAEYRNGVVQYPQDRRSPLSTSS